MREKQEPRGWCVNAYRCISCNFPPTSKYQIVILGQPKVCERIYEPSENLEGQPAQLVIETPNPECQLGISSTAGKSTNLSGERRARTVFGKETIVQEGSCCPERSRMTLLSGVTEALWVIAVLIFCRMDLPCSFIWWWFVHKVSYVHTILPASGGISTVLYRLCNFTQWLFTSTEQLILTRINIYVASVSLFQCFIWRYLGFLLAILKLCEAVGGGHCNVFETSLWIYFKTNSYYITFYWIEISLYFVLLEPILVFITILLQFWT